MEWSDEAWAAYFDGEGTIGWSHGLRVTVGSTYYPTVQALKNRWGGSFHEYIYQGTNRQLWTWGVYGDSARAFLKAVRPYLREKAEQADAALSFPVLSRGNHRDDRAWLGGDKLGVWLCSFLKWLKKNNPGYKPR